MNIDGNYHEKCERNEGHCHDSNGCETCEDERRKELVREAAPDLLEALKLYVSAYDPDGRHHRDNCFATGPMTGNAARDLFHCPGCAAYEAARAAIAKAEGR